MSLGIPQDSILGTILFLMYVNDLSPFMPGIKCILFADDTTFLHAAKNHKEVIVSATKRRQDPENYFNT